MRKLRTVTTAAFCSLVLGATVGAAERHFEKKFQVSPGTALLVDTNRGSVTLRGTSTNEVSIAVDIRGRDDDVARFELSAQQTPSGVEIRGRHRRRGWGFFGGWTGPEVRFVISVPRTCVPHLRTEGSGIDVSDVQGYLDASTSGGSIRVHAAHGGAALITSGGGIDTVDTKGTLRLRTSGGGISVVSATGPVDAETSGGGVTVTNAHGGVRAATSGGSIVADVRGENGGIEARTSGGGVTLSVAKDVRATIDAATSGGSVTCDLPVTASGRFGRHSLRGSVNGGGPLIYARTSGGSIHIRALE